MNQHTANLPTPQQLDKIKALIFDFDGVMTDGSVWTADGCDPIRAGNIKDGYAIQYAVKKGYTVAVLSGATSSSIEKRMSALGVKHILMGCANKISSYRDFLDEQGLTDEQVLYMGDDIPDYEVMLHCGIAACPADAADEIRSVAHYVSDKPGGKGCVRDVMERVMRRQGTWFHPDAVNW